MEQRSPEWFEARCGSLGASVVGKALGRLKRSNERTKEATDLMFEIAAERLTGVPAKRVNALTWGRDHEDEARAAYAFLTNAEVTKVGLIPHPTIAGAHCSPDALVGEDGGLEIKAPTSAAHLQTLLADAIPEEHLPQLHWNLACSGRAFWDFESYDPRFPPDMRLFVKRIERDEAIIAKMEEEVRSFLADVDAQISLLTGVRGQAWKHVPRVEAQP
jgi:predicted phage-related endonuclease